MILSVLVLGGTTEARLLAGRLASLPGLAPTLSLAGRTVKPLAQPVPTRVGGFGGTAGLTRYLAEHRTALLVDATHPYAARISANAAAAAQRTGVPLLALRRPPWSPTAGDRWREVDNFAEAAAALGERPRRVFLALGRQEVGAFEAAPQHHYLIRSVDPVVPPPALPQVRYILARGPFPEADEEALLRDHAIDTIACKNSGGTATYGKIVAARRLGIEVLMARRPPLPEATAKAATVAEAARWIAAHFALPEPAGPAASDT